jgi:hypothetical protein
MANLNLSLSDSGVPPAGLEWTLTYSAADLAAVNVTPGPAATAAGKTVSCAGGNGTYSCVLVGMNENTISSGIVAVVGVTVASTPADPSAAITVLQPEGTDPVGNLLSLTASGGSVVIPAPVTNIAGLTGLICSPNPLVTPGTASCTATVSAPAPAGGLMLSTGVASGKTRVTVPSTANIASGTTSVTFGATAATVGGMTTAVVVASLNSASQQTSIQLAPPLTITRLACSPNRIYSGGSTICSITLSGIAPSGGTAVSIALQNSAPLTLPPSVTVPAGSATAQFTATAGTVTANQTAYIIFTLAGKSPKFGVNLAAGKSN